MKKFRTATIGISILMVAILVGCGNQQNATNNTGTANTANTSTTTSKAKKGETSLNGGKTIVEGGQNYSGKANLKKYKDAADKNPNNVQDLINAAISSRLNGDEAGAISYYKKAIQADPKSGLAYNNLGNIYFRDKSDAKVALPYYQKATKVQPSYSYGWLNLGEAQASAGDTAAAKSTIAQGLKIVKKSDPVYKMLQSEQATLNKSK